jgi:hypothetical protein
MSVNRLYGALQKLAEAILELENEVAAMKAEHDPLASHIFVSRRQYRNAHDTKGGVRSRRGSATTKPARSASEEVLANGSG